MYANYHTHTYHCRHASGTPEEYVKEAIKNGLEVLGFSEHGPCVFKNGHMSGFRLPLEETEDYVREISQLREKYSDKIRIYIGYEIEYYPKTHEDTMAFIKKFGYDYLILGQHFTNNEYDGTSSWDVCDRSVLESYVEQVIAGMNTGAFAYVAHPDVLNYRTDTDEYKTQMTRLCKAALEKNIPLEFNLYGLSDNRYYPTKAFWEIVGEVGNSVIIGCDAHSADRVGNPNEYKEGLNILKKLQIKPIDRLDFTAF